MLRTVGVLLCMLVPLMAEPIRKVLREDPFLSAAVNSVPQMSSDRAEMRPGIAQQLMSQEDSPARQTDDSAAHGYLPSTDELGEEIPLIASGAIDRNLGNSVELAIGLLMTLVLLRDYFLGRRDCLDYQQLNEHLAIAARSLDEARGRYLMADYHRAIGADSELAAREREIAAIRNGLMAYSRMRRFHSREIEQLQEHLILAGRSLESARARWFRAARQIGLPERHQIENTGEPMDFVRREQEVEAIQNALAVCSGREEWHDRNACDLREHLALAGRNLDVARAEWLVKAYRRAAQESAEVTALEEVVNRLKAAIEGHCRIHGCQPAHAPEHSLAGVTA